MKKFLICAHCGNIVTYVRDAGVPLVCCGERMKEIVPNSTDAAGEKHVPVVTVGDGVVKVSVGAVSHPMTAEHSIQWVAIETTRGLKVNYLAPDAAPETCFRLCNGEELVQTYAYCNLHGLFTA